MTLFQRAPYSFFVRHRKTSERLIFRAIRGENETDVAARLGLHLSAARVAAGLSQAELGARISRSVQTISRYERGISLPPVPTLKKLAEVLGASVDALLGRREP